jgi:signal recognition particle receptor subunit beta
MVLFNYSTKELTAKVVYYGPGLCGKTTNLLWIHERLPIKNKGKMLSLATETDRTLFFDFLPIELGTIRGMKTRIQLYTVPGQVFYNATRRMVLKGADCIVFVCDSQEAMLEANLESLENLRENLEVNEIDPDEIPMVIQYNKRDLPNALPIENLNERLNPRSLPAYEAVALKGIGVEDTLKGVTGLVFRSLAAKYGAAEGGVPPPVPLPRPDLTPAPAPPPQKVAPPPPAPPSPPPSPHPSLNLEGEEGDDDLLDSLELHPSADDQGGEVVESELPDTGAEEEEEIAFDSPTPRFDPKTTLIRGEEEAADIRRRISRPPSVNLEKLEEEVADEEEIEALNLDDTPPPPAPPAPAPRPTPPAPQRMASPQAGPRPVAAPARPAPPPPAPPAPAQRAGSAVHTLPPLPSAQVQVELGGTDTEVVVPISLHLADGQATEVKVHIRLALSLKVDR